MYRTHTCGALRRKDVGQKVVLSGWVQTVRDKGKVLWIDLRDRYGITQLVFEEGISPKMLMETVKKIGREFVIQASGVVVERLAKNEKIPTGAIEIRTETLSVLSTSDTPPFLIEDQTDGGEELRMKYRYLDLRRTEAKNKLILRHKLAKYTRDYLDLQNFIEVETPVLIKSTPEGARDFLVPSRIHPGEFYALPQSPQTFKQLLMVAGFDRYFQLVKCFRDEDLRADRQPEFTQIDCEMSFVTQAEVLTLFEGLAKHLFKKICNTTLPDFPKMDYAEAMRLYGSDKPDLRFGMPFNALTPLAQGKGFKIFDQAEAVLGICAEGCANYTRKQIDALTNWVKRPQIGAKGMVYVKCNTDGTFKSSVDKFYTQDDLAAWASACNAKSGDLLLVLSGELAQTQKALSALRLEMGERLGLRDKNVFSPLWVVNFPLLEYDPEAKRWHAMHHPFTAPLEKDLPLLTEKPEQVRANAYDLVINGVEIGGGSIRIHKRETQEKMFDALGFSPEDARKLFGFLLDAFRYGAPPHGGIAFGFDRLCALLDGANNIRDYIAFPKNTSGRDVMIDSPSPASQEQLKELGITTLGKTEK